MQVNILNQHRFKACKLGFLGFTQFNRRECACIAKTLFQKFGVYLNFEKCEHYIGRNTL